MKTAEDAKDAEKRQACKILKKIPLFSLRPLWFSFCLHFDGSTNTAVP